MSVTFGMVGLGNISHRFLRGLKFVKHAEVIAVASRSYARAKAYADSYAIPHAYGTYEEMLENQDIDAIYIATPNDLHEDYMMKALQYGKHVLCEKPFTVHTKQAQHVFDYAKAHDLIVMEAMKACFLPTTYKVKEWLAQGCIGKLRYMEAGYCYRCENIPQTHHLYAKQRGGGSFYDVGIYPLAFLNEIHQKPIQSYQSNHIYEQGIDVFTQVILQYEDHVLASIRSGIFADMENKAVFYGDKGSICIPQFWKSERAYLRVHGQDEVCFEELHDASEFRYQIQHFVSLIQQHQSESDIMSEKATINNMKLLEGVIFK